MTAAAVLLTVSWVRLAMCQLKDDTRFDYFGVYDDQLVKTPSGWRIKTRKQYPLFMQGAPAPVRESPPRAHRKPERAGICNAASSTMLLSVDAGPVLASRALAESAVISL